MRNGEIKIPYTPTRKLENIDLTSELNIERFQLMKTGHLCFSHPDGGHDDVFWSIALEFTQVYNRSRQDIFVGFVEH